MRLFTDSMEMIKEVERDLFEMGTVYQTATVQDQEVKDDPKFQTKELFGYGYTLVDFSESRLEKMAFYTGYLDGKEEWLDSEIDERLFAMSAPNHPLNPGHAWKINEDLWGKFIRDGLFSYSYAERWQAQIPYVIRELQLRPNSRQAMITMYDRHEDMMNWGGRDRVPCSVSYQFLIREGKLNCLYNQRSCDFYKFFGADVYFTVRLQKYIARALNIDCGQFVHMIGSLHAFAGDFEGKDIF